MLDPQVNPRSVLGVSEDRSGAYARRTVEVRLIPVVLRFAAFGIGSCMIRGCVPLWASLTFLAVLYAIQEAAAYVWPLSGGPSIVSVSIDYFDL